MLLCYTLWPVWCALRHRAKHRRWISSLNPNSLRGKRLQWRHYVGSLQLSKQKRSMWKQEKRKKRAIDMSNLVNKVAARRENTCVLPKSVAPGGLIAAGAIFGRVWVRRRDDKNAPWVRQESAKSVEKKMPVHKSKRWWLSSAGRAGCRHKHGSESRNKL